MDLRAKIGQLFFVGIGGPIVDEDAERLLREISPGGICLFARNIREPAQTRELNERIIEILPVMPLISIDQEGGLVDRLRRIITPMPSPEKLKNIEDVALMGSIIAEVLGLLGFNMNFAPVLDIIDEKRLRFVNGLQSRSFGANAEDVIERAGAFLTSLQAGGCIGCIKHFPGLGAAEVDSHEVLPEVRISFDELSEFDLLTFKRFIETGEARAVMVAHADYRNAGFHEEDKRGRAIPSSLNRRVITGLLREKLGFEGVVITDDLEMGAIVRDFGIGEACKMAIEAGADMLAICAGADSIYAGFEAVLGAVKAGELSESRIDDSFSRIMKLKALIRSAPDFEPNRIEQLSADITALKSRLN